MFLEDTQDSEYIVPVFQITRLHMSVMMSGMIVQIFLQHLYKRKMLSISGMCIPNCHGTISIRFDTGACDRYEIISNTHLTHSFYWLLSIFLQALIRKDLCEGCLVHSQVCQGSSVHSLFLYLFWSEFLLFRILL